MATRKPDTGTMLKEGIMDLQQQAAGRVDWHPIAEITNDRLDGRDVLLWKGSPIVGTYLDGWCDPVGRPVHGATHYADVEGPSA